MKRKLYDYSGFRLSRLREPRFSHVLLWLTWVVYFVLYFLTENLIPAERCHVMHCFLDDLMPFCEYFAIFYVGWYLLVAGSLAYYFFYDPRQFSQLELYIFITQILAMACYIIFPSRQDLRPEVFPRENVLTWIMGIIYSFDTNTGVCPSLHVAYSLAILSVVWKDENVTKIWKLLLALLVVLISLATAFVKQHSMVDVFAAIPTALVGELLIFRLDVFKLSKKQIQA